MRKVFRRWPPLIWLLVYFGSLMIVMGTGRRDLLIVGLVVVTITFIWSVFLAGGPSEEGRPRPPGVWWAIGGVVLFYVFSAVVALVAGVEYAIISLFAGLVPATAAALIVATTRTKTGEKDHHVVSETQSDEEDPFPGIGMDEETPLGDTTETSDAPEGAPTGQRRAPALRRAPATSGAYGAQVPSELDRPEANPNTPGTP